MGNSLKGLRAAAESHVYAYWRFAETELSVSELTQILKKASLAFLDFETNGGRGTARALLGRRMGIL